ncbi:unnamed protein product [Prunus brigantina]
MEMDKEKECLTMPQALGICMYFCFAGAIWGSFCLIKIMKNNEDHKLSLTLVVYFIVVRHILVIFFFAVIMKFFVEVVCEVVTRQRKVEPPSTVEAGESKSMV